MGSQKDHMLYGMHDKLENGLQASYQAIYNLRGCKRVIITKGAHFLYNSHIAQVPGSTTAFKKTCLHSIQKGLSS